MSRQRKRRQQPDNMMTTRRAMQQPDTERSVPMPMGNGLGSARHGFVHSTRLGVLMSFVHVM